MLGGLLLWVPLALAQDCDPVPAALSDLDSVVGSFFEGGGAAEFYCPDDLNEGVDLEAADDVAGRMDAEGRAASASELLRAAQALDSSEVQAAANAAALIDALLAAALAAGGDPAAMVDGLLAMAAASPGSILERQIALNLLRHDLDDPRVKALLEKYLPSKPDYDRIFGDNRTEVRTVFRTGWDGFKHGEIRRAFERQGATVEVVKENKHWRITHKVKPDDPSLPEITWIIDVVTNAGHTQELFEDMASTDPSVTMFADHSQLGTSMDRGLDNRPVADGSTDFYWVNACKSKVFASRLSQAYPMAHFIYTKDSEFFRDMPMSFERGLVALANHYDYDQMRRLVGAGSAWQPKNYIFPNDPQKLVYQDQDGDGISDAEDRLFNVPVEGAPNGELATRAVHIANTYMSYSGAYQYYSNRRSVVVEDTYRPDGIFDGEPGGPVTRIETRTDTFGEQKHFVAVSDEALSMHQTERTARIAAEMGVHQGKQRTWDENRTQAGGFLLGAAVYDVWNGGEWDSYRDAAFPGLTIDSFDAAKYLDDHNFVVENSLSTFLNDHVYKPD
jgi:hypothetical protein